MIVLRKEKGEWGVAPRERLLAEYLRYGIALIDKPRGPSSHETSTFVRRILGVKKTGHSGTLDANVSGVLPVLLEESCKASAFLLKQRKSYVCVTRFAKPVPHATLNGVLSRFRGKIRQMPPRESAVAKRLREREVYALDILEVDERARLALFECEVEAGFYVRALVRDLGMALGIAAEMAELRRTMAAGFREEQCVSLQELSDRYWLARERGDEEPLRKCVIPLEEAISLKRVVVSDVALRPITQGANVGVQSVCALDEGIARGDVVQVLSLKGELVCFARALLSSEEVRKRWREEREGRGWGELAFDVERVVHRV